MPNIDGLTGVTIALRAMELLDDIIVTLRRLHQPVIAAVNGPAIGGGLCLALACDVRVAAESAYFRAAGINNGLTASELGLSYLLPRAIGSSRAAEIMLTGRDVDAVEAATIGLVSRVVPDDQLLDSASRPRRHHPWSRPGVELTKRTLQDSLDAASLEQHMHARASVSCCAADHARTSRKPSPPARRSATHVSSTAHSGGRQRPSETVPLTA